MDSTAARFRGQTCVLQCYNLRLLRSSLTQKSIPHTGPLVAEDLYAMDEKRTAAYLATQFEGHFDRRRREIEEWNQSIDDGTMNPSFMRKSWWRVRCKVTGFGREDGKREVGIALALFDTFRWPFSTGPYLCNADSHEKNDIDTLIYCSRTVQGSS